MALEIHWRSGGIVNNKEESLRNKLGKKKKTTTKVICFKNRAVQKQKKKETKETNFSGLKLLYSCKK